MSNTREKPVELRPSALRNQRTTATAIHGIVQRTVTPVTHGIVAASPQSGKLTVHAHPSWGIVAVQYVSDRDRAKAAARAAGRRMVDKYGAALERLAE